MIGTGHTVRKLAAFLGPSPDTPPWKTCGASNGTWQHRHRYRRKLCTRVYSHPDGGQAKAMARYAAMQPREASEVCL